MPAKEIWPNGTPLRRSLTFYGLPKEFPASFSPDLTVAFPKFPGPGAPAVLVERQAELLRVASDMVVRAILDSEKGAVLASGLAEAKPLGRPARYVESMAVLNDDYHLALGGMRNPHLENVVLNGIDVNEPGVKYAYSGLGFELAAKAMEIVAGESAVRLYDEHLFRPLGFGDVPIGSASADGEFTAMELGILAQWVANRGSYGPWEFIRPKTFQRLLPEPLHVTDRSYIEDEGIGIHWLRHLKAGSPAGSKRNEDLLFSPRTMGHGSFSGCVFLVDPEQQLIVTQVRKRTGPRHEKWSPRFFQTIAAVLSK